MAYDFLHYTPGTDVLPVDYSWLDEKRIKTFIYNIKKHFDIVLGRGEMNNVI